MPNVVINVGGKPKGKGPEMKSRNLYKFLSLLGDFRAVFKGRMHKRYVRKQVIKQAGKANRRWLR